MEDKSLKINNETLEKMIISNLIKNESFFLKVGEYLHTKNFKTKSYFSDSKLQAIFNFVCNYYLKFKKLPHKDEAVAMIDSLKGIDDEQKIFTKKAAEYVYGINLDSNIEYIENETINFIKQARAVEAILLSQVDIENGEYDNLDKRLRDATNINFDRDLGVSIKDFEKNFEMIRQINDESRSVKLPFEALDRVYGRINPGELFCYAGVSGIGKSIWLMQTALSAYQSGKKAVFFTLETSVKRLLTRVYQSLFNRSAMQLLEQEIPKHLIENGTSKDGDLIIKQFGANEANANLFNSFLNDLYTTQNYKPDIVIVDYVGICATNDKTMSTENTYKYYKTVSEELRNLGMLWNCPVASACQINRSGIDEKGGSKNTLSMKHISDSKGIVDTTDYLCIILQPASKKANLGEGIGEYDMLVEKNRNGSSGQRVKIKIEYRTMSMSEL